MLHHNSLDTPPPLMGSQAASLLQQGKLGAELVRRAQTQAQRARTEQFGFAADQAAGLRRAVAAPMRLVPPADPSGDAA